MNFNSCHNKNILVTGGAGYLATNLIAQLHATDCHIIRVSRPGVKCMQLDGKFTLQDIAADIRERGLWEKLIDDQDIIFHFAAQTSVSVAEQDPPADLAINVLPMLHLLETCKQKKLNPIILFAGTVTEVGLTEYLPVSEACLDHPITVYDLHKWMAEHYLKYYARMGITRGAVLRLANVYGPGPKSSSTDRGMLNMMIRKALQGQALTVYGEGEYIRDYVYVEDVVRAFLDAVTHIDSLSGQHFIIGSGEGHTILQAMNLIAERATLKTGQPVPVVHVDPPSPPASIELRQFVADTHQYTKLTGWRAEWPLLDGIDATIQEFIARENNR